MRCDVRGGAVVTPNLAQAVTATSGLAFALSRDRPTIIGRIGLINDIRVRRSSAAHLWNRERE